MKSRKRGFKPKDDSQPQIYKPENAGGKWTFNRRDFLKFALATAAGTAAAFLPGVGDKLRRHVQVVAHSTELTQSTLQPGQPLTKIWYFRNNTDHPWGEGAVLSLVGAAAWQAEGSIPLPNLEPGQITTVRVPMVAPESLDPRPIEASVEIVDGFFNFFLPVIHKAPAESPCPCVYDSCMCDGDIPCGCDIEPPCTCDYDVPCTCHYYYCSCDYEIPCVCDYLPPCTCDYDVPCVCDYLPPCTCDYDVPCVCDYLPPCACDYYIPCGCVYFF
jgi:hypothetical protein